MAIKPLVLAALAGALLAAGCAKDAPNMVARPEGLNVYPGKDAPPGAIVLWPVAQDPMASIRAAGLEPLDKEHDTWHLHAHLEVYKDGAQIVVPSLIGIGPGGAYVSALHTHDATGVIHVESPTIADYTIGQLFAEWGVPLDGAQAIENGKLAPDPAKVVFDDMDLITVVFGEMPPGLM